ncbi:hypothetical protein [Streptomyces mutabilis]|uniref:hypothetical protein n=1 Tax=Streptomyces mutabilis TaxID=67332 RepID=UPI003A4C70F4
MTHPAPLKSGPRCARRDWCGRKQATSSWTPPEDDLVVLALLGRLDPENVILRPAGRPAAVTSPGGSGPSHPVTLVDPPQAH